MFSNKQAIVIGPTPPGTGVIAARHGFRLIESNIADQPRLAAVLGFQSVHPDIDHRRTRFNPITAHHLGAPDRGHQNISAAAHLGEVLRA